MKKTAFKTVDEYISLCPENVQQLLQEIRSAIREAAPKATEEIAYNMPAYKLFGPLVYFAAAKNHIGFYAIPTAIVEFREELKKYKTSKGTVQFPIETGIPKSLVKKMVRFRVKENMEKQKLKELKKKNKK